MTAQTSANERPAPGAICLRLDPSELAVVDAWAATQADNPSRPEAIRRLLLAGAGPQGAVVVATDGSVVRKHGSMPTVALPTVARGLG